MSSPKVTVVVIADSYPKLAATLTGLGAAKGNVPFTTKVFAVNPSQALIKSNRVDMQVKFNGSKTIAPIDYAQAIQTMLVHDVDAKLIVVTWDGVKFADHWLEVLLEGVQHDASQIRTPALFVPQHCYARSLLDEDIREKCWQHTGEKWGEGPTPAVAYDLECQNPIAFDRWAISKEKPMFDFDTFSPGKSFGHTIFGREIQKVRGSLFFI